MLYFVLWVLATVALYINFRLHEKFRIHTLQAIIFNYWVCVCTGTLFEWAKGTIIIPDFSSSQNMPWLLASLLLGTTFISTFYVIALATQKTGVMLTSLASRVSFVLPVCANVWLLGTVAASDMTLMHYGGMLLTLLAVILSSFKKEASPTEKRSIKPEMFIFPLAVFIITGGIDTAINFVNHKLLPKEYEAFFSVLLFGVSALIGLCLLVYRYVVYRHPIAFRNVIAGILLGIPNYFTIYLMLEVLRHYQNNGALVFPIFNISVIVVSALIAFLGFKEKMYWYNWLGIGVAILAIGMVAY